MEELKVTDLELAFGHFLVGLGKTILEGGLPKTPFIVQGAPGADYGMFIAIWPNIGDRKEDCVPFKFG